MSAIIGPTHRPIYGEGSSAPYVDKSAAAWAIQQGYKLRFTHANGHTVEFPANITSFTDSHNAETEKRVYMDDPNPVPQLLWTARRVSFTLSLANASLEEARYNAQSVNLLICMMYSSLDVNDALTDKPKIYCRGLTFIQDDRGGVYDKDGIGLYINNLSYSPNIDAGFITSKGTGILGEDEIYPVQIDIQIQGDAIILESGDGLTSPFGPNYPTYR